MNIATWIDWIKEVFETKDISWRENRFDKLSFVEQRSIIGISINKVIFGEKEFFERDLIELAYSDSEEFPKDFIISATFWIFVYGGRGASLQVTQKIGLLPKKSLNQFLDFCDSHKLAVKQ